MERLNFIAMFMCFLTDNYHGSADAASQPSNVIAGLQWGSMTTYLKTKGRVYHLEEDAYVPGNILFAEDSTLRTTDGNTIDLVVGSRFGYAEGRSAQAEFNSITGFLQTNANHVLLVDNGNNCVRQASRITNETSPFVGSCKSSGFKDGRYQASRFYYPFSVIRNPMNAKAAIVIEHWNRALRSVDLATGDVGTLIKDLPASVFGAAVDSDKESIFLTFTSFLGKFNIKTSSFTPLTPITSREGLDGMFSKASFGNARGIACMNITCLVADQGSNRLRILDFSKQRMYSVCTGNFAWQDGATPNCSLKYPYSLLLKSETLYIGEFQAIRRISVKELVPCEDISILLTAGEKEKCFSENPAQRICLPYGVHNYTVKETNCTIKINISRDLNACQSKLCLNSGICTAGDNGAYTCACRDGWTGRNCQTDVNIQTRIDFSANYKLSCSVLSDFIDLILSVAKRRYVQIKQLSSDFCNQTSDSGITLSCTMDILKVVWPTDCIFDSSTLKEKERTLKVVNENLLKINRNLLELVIPNHIPPLVQPLLNTEGHPVSVLLTPLCPGGLKYINTTQTCQ